MRAGCIPFAVRNHNGAGKQAAWGIQLGISTLQRGGGRDCCVGGGRFVTQRARACTGDLHFAEGGVGRANLCPRIFHRSLLGGRRGKYRLQRVFQGRGAAAEALIADARAVQAAGAFALVLELVPAPLAAEITATLQIPTIGIGAGNETDGQILVWTDFAGLTAQKPRKFVRRFANIRQDLLAAAQTYRAEVQSSGFPSAEESFSE
mgnify:CR=1 FL=1